MMKRTFLTLAAAAVLALPAAGGIAQRRPAPAAARDWTRTVVATADGVRMGNPNAPVKVIEFFSLACGHCAAFAAESSASLDRNYIRSGRVSLEMRTIVINGPDVAAAMLVRCAAPRASIDMSRTLMAIQGQWLARASALTAAEQTELRGLSGGPRLLRLARIMGLDRVAARHGMTAAAQRACLTSPQRLARLEALQTSANAQYHVTGTPTFVINGRVIEDTNTWAGIEPLLRGR
jgi:protein-disulfide isomerase